jgi:ketosteroid isomerase-like protein
MESAIVWTFENGRIVRAAAFPSRAEAREAAGLPAG